MKSFVVYQTRVVYNRWVFRNSVACKENLFCWTL